MDDARQTREQVTLGVDTHADLHVAVALDERGRWSVGGIARDRRLQHAVGHVDADRRDVVRADHSPARIDSSAAWNLVMNQGIAAFAAWLPAAAHRSLSATVHQSLLEHSTHGAPRSGSTANRGLADGARSAVDVTTGPDLRASGPVGGLRSTIAGSEWPRVRAMLTLLSLVVDVARSEFVLTDDRLNPRCTRGSRRGSPGELDPTSRSLRQSDLQWRSA